MKRIILTYTLAFSLLSAYAGEGGSPPLKNTDKSLLIDYVDPFIGTTNFGTTNPGAICPNGMMSVVPFNVMGSSENTYDKDARWWSTPYEYTNCFFTGYAHVNLSGVGCPELGSLLLMPTTGELNVDYKEYGSKYKDEQASPGYYSNYLTKYNVKTEVSATPRSGIARFTFPKGKSHILLNLGEGLTNESGAMLRRVSDSEVEGVKLLGTFCYNPQAVFPIYFVLRVKKNPSATGYWKKQRPMMGVEAEWDKDQGKYKLYTRYGKEIAGDDIGTYFSFDTEEGEQVEVQMGVSFVSIENARLNLDREQAGKDFEKIHAEARSKWNDDLSRITVEGGTDAQKTVAEWDKDQGKYKLYTRYGKEIAGDDIGTYFSFDTEEGEQVEVQMGVSFVSIENARLNLDREQAGKDFEKIHAEARSKWNDDLSRITVEGGTDAQKTVFYTALYHLLIHPNILQDVNGEYPAMESDKILTTKGDRYTVFSLWDTYRNVHQLLTLVYPERQMEMVRTMLDMYREHGWLPKWELYGRETLTMEGDPSIPVIVDTWMKGLRDFDVDLAYEAMYKSATLPGAENLMRPDNDDYMSKGYVPLREQYDNSVSHALEYYIADFALSRFAAALGKKKDAEMFYKRSLGYKHYYSKEFGTFRPILPDGTFYSPFNPRQGENFEPNPGFHEGSSWNYTFYVPHDVYGLAKLMGGKKPFIDKLQMVFDEGLYDPANEPDIAYAHLFSYFKGEEWRTQKETQRLLDKYFTTKPDGIPGNDDTGTMSSWAIFNMIGFYPDCPGLPEYTLTTPVFNKVTIRLDPKWYKENELVIETNRTQPGVLYINKVLLNGKKFNKYHITHDELVHGKYLKFDLK